jgi:hypothetical protein
MVKIYSCFFYCLKIHLQSLKNKTSLGSERIYKVFDTSISIERGIDTFKLEDSLLENK